MSVSDEVRWLEERVKELESESEHRKNLLIDQHANYRKHLALRDQQLMQAAETLNESEKRELAYLAEIDQLKDKLARYRVVRDMLKQSEYGEHPMERPELPDSEPEKLQFFRERVN